MRPDVIQWVRFWDWAVTPERGDYTVGALVGKDTTGRFIIADVIRGQWEWAEAKKIIISTAEMDTKNVWIGIEEVAKDTAFLKELKWELLSGGFFLRALKPTKSKTIRSMLWEPIAEQGMISLVRGDWISAFLSEVCSFPFGTHDDQVDAISGAAEMLTTYVSMPRDGEAEKPEPKKDAHLRYFEEYPKHKKDMFQKVREMI
jgi:predicted phage terminase large subunit-like protein